MKESDSNSGHCASPAEVDCRGLLCPEPVLRVHRAIRALPAGCEVLVLATDPLAELDLAVFCQRHGHELLEARTVEGVLRFRLRISPAPPSGAG